MDIEKAIQIVREEYEKAKELSFVYNPVAYALYSAWKKVDEMRCK